jgi:hypothetical protein
MPNGTELYVVSAAQHKGVDVVDDLDAEERRALDESIREGIEDMEAGRTIDAKTAIAQLRCKSSPQHVLTARSMPTWASC